MYVLYLINRVLKEGNFQHLIFFLIVGLPVEEGTQPLGNSTSGQQCLSLSPTELDYWIAGEHLS